MFAIKLRKWQIFSMRIIVAVSGGMDSLYTLLSLKKAGHDVAALHARFISPPTDPVPDLAAFCKNLDIPFYVANLQSEFKSGVIKPFLTSYQQGQTPNPCAICNKSLKLGRLLEIARNYSAEFLATGHYACLENHPKSGQICLKSAKDKSKNQSYFLALTPLEQLRHCLFPLADQNKKQIESELNVNKVKIPIAKESQEVCFIPNDNYREFIEREADKFSIEFQGGGQILLLNAESQEFKNLGQHNGLWNYTEGQRKGIGIAHSEPLYVIKKDYNSNILYVGNQSFLNIDFALATNLNFFVLPEQWPTKLFAQNRYKERPSEAEIFLIDYENNLEINLSSQNKYELLDKLEQNLKLNQESLISHGKENKLFHVLTDDQIYSSDTEQLYFQRINAWNKAKFGLRIEFKEKKQVYAKGQVLAIYDENEFILAGGILS